MKQPDAKLYDFLDQAAKAGREWAKKQPGYEQMRQFRDGEDFDDSAHEAELTGYPEPMTVAELKATMFPAPRFIVAKLIREGLPQTLDGDGGIGKSNVGEGFAVARAAGVPIFGQETIQGPALFITKEDEYGDCKRTAEAYANYLKVDFESLPLRFWSLQENDMTLAIVDDKGAWTKGPFYDALEAKLKEAPGLFVVLDCRSDVVQMNEILREPPNTFYKTVLTPLCKKYGSTILVLCHPSKASMSDGSFYSGGTGNKSSLRNKLVMRLEDPNGPDTGPRVLEVLKRNQGARPGLIRLTFDPSWNIFVPDDDVKVREGERDLYNRVLDAVLELLKKRISVVASHGAGWKPKDVAAHINRERKPEDTAVTAKQVASMLKIAEGTGALGYRGGHGKDRAGYYSTTVSEPWDD